MKLGSIARQLGCELKGDADIDIRRVVAIEEAQPGDLTFVSNRKYVSRVKTTTASAVIVENSFQEIPTATLRTANPYLAFAKAVELFYQAPAPAPVSIRPRGFRARCESRAECIDRALRRDRRRCRDR